MQKANTLRWSLQLGNLFGIRIQVHWTFVLIILWVIFIYARQGSDLYQMLWAILFVLSVFGCVVLHELGHALTARQYGIPTKDITLLPIGGVARLERMPEAPKAELLIAVAGPLVNVVIALCLFLLLNLTGQWHIPAEAELQYISRETFLVHLTAINVLLVLFNAIPAFPMDGGRMLRALLAFRLDRTVATNIAATTGQLLAIVFAFAGLFYNPFLIIIGVFVYLGAQAEAHYVQTQSSLSGYRVQDILMHRFAVLQTGDPVSKAVAHLLNSQEKGFIVMEDDQVVGILSRDDVIRALSEGGKATPVKDIMNTDFKPLHPRTPLIKVYQQLRQSKYPILPVLEDGAFLGVLDLENITEYIEVQNAMKKKRLQV